MTIARQIAAPSGPVLGGGLPWESSSGGAPPAPINTVAPAITGSLYAGATLTCSTGTWTLATSYAYQWKRAGVSIGGETAATHVAVLADEGTSVTCAVAATGPGGTTSADSAGVTIDALLDYADATFARTSEAAFVDPRSGWSFDATIPWAAANVARIFADNAILIEGARTNGVTNSQALGGAGWFGTATQQANQTTAPDGTATADLMTNAGTTFDQNRRYANSGSTGVNSVVSTYVKQHTGVGASIQGKNGAGGTYAGGLVPTAAWQRVAAPASVNDGFAEIFTCLNGQSGTGVNGDKHYFWGVQAEAGGFPTAPVRTTGAAATRTADQTTITAAAIGPAFLNGHWSVVVTPEAGSAVAPANQYVYYLDADNYLSIVAGTTIRLRAAGTSYDVAGLSYAALTALTIDVNFAGGALTVTGGGGGSASPAGDWSGSGADADVGWDGTGNHFYGVIGLPVPA